MSSDRQPGPTERQRTRTSRAQIVHPWQFVLPLVLVIAVFAAMQLGASTLNVAIAVAVSMAIGAGGSWLFANVLY